MRKLTLLGTTSFLLATGCSTGLRPTSGSASDGLAARAEPPPPVPTPEEAPAPSDPAPARVTVSEPYPAPARVADPMNPAVTGPQAVRMLPPHVWAVPQATSGGSCCAPAQASTCCPKPCKTECPCPRPCSMYGGVSAEFSPGLGGGIHFGRVFERSRSAEWSWEIGLSYQDLWFDVVEESRTGKSAQVRAGFKMSTCPRDRSHLVGRAGFTYYQVTGEGVDQEWIDLADGDYVGVYGSVGWEWDLSCSFTTGPEVGVSVVSEVESFEEVDFVPFARWNFILRL